MPQDDKPRRRYSYFKGNCEGEPVYAVNAESLEQADGRARKAGHNPDKMGLSIAFVPKQEQE